MRPGILCAFLLISFATHAQMYFMGGVDFHQYEYDKSLMLTDEPLFATLRVGFEFYKAKNGRFELGSELGPIGRRFNRELGEDTFQYKFPGLQALLIGQYNLTQKIYLDGGVAGALQVSNLRRNGTRRKMGSGFRSTDVGAAAGAGVKLSDRFSVGYRYTYWFLDMLEYRIISDLGEMGGKQTDIRASNHLIYLRFHLLDW